VAGEPSRERGTGKDALIFLVKLVVFLTGLTGFGLLVFWLRRSLS